MVLSPAEVLKITDLPLEILLAISKFGDHTVWRGLLLLRPFAEYTFWKGTRETVLCLFAQTTVKEQPDCTITTTSLFQKDHSFFGMPSRIMTLKRKVKIATSREWQHFGILHREGGPARVAGIFSSEDEISAVSSITSHLDVETPRILYAMWYYRGEVHREGGPALIIITSAGHKIDEFVLEWRKNSRRHNSFGAARSKFVFCFGCKREKCNGYCLYQISAEYYLDGEKTSETEYIVQDINLLSRYYRTALQNTLL